MSPQTFSLPPSWDRMYTSGMTVQEIADLTGRARSTVHRHLQVRDAAGAGLRAVHEAARLARGPDWPTTHWQHNYKAAQDFYKLNGRLPKADDDVAAEHKLVAWLGTQRAAHRSGALPAIKVTLMGVIPDWERTVHHTTLDDRWRKRLDELVTFVAEAGRMPRYRRYSSEHEHALGVWLHTQHQRRGESRLSAWRLVALDAAVPGWHSFM